MNNFFTVIIKSVSEVIAEVGFEFESEAVAFAEAYENKTQFEHVLVQVENNEFEVIFELAAYK